MDVTDRKCKIAQTLAVFCRQAHVIAAGSGEVDELSASGEAVPNEYLAAIDQVKDLEGFAAVIYSSNFEFEATQDRETADALTDLPDVQALEEVLLSEPTTSRNAEEPSTTLEESNEIYDTDRHPSLEVLVKEEVTVEHAPESAMPGSTTEISAPAPPPADVTSPDAEETAPVFESAWVKALRREDGEDFTES